MTADRTTIKAVFDEFVSKLRDNLVADPPTDSKPFRGVVVADADPDASPRPFLAARVTRITPIAAVDNDKIMSADSTLYIATDALASDPHAVIFDQIGAVDDYLDSLIDTGVLEGAEGFDDRRWNLHFPSQTAGARVVTAEAVQTFFVKVEREQNREPAS